jgi:hypothetical protein
MQAIVFFQSHDGADIPTVHLNHQLPNCPPWSIVAISSNSLPLAPASIHAVNRQAEAGLQISRLNIHCSQIAAFIPRPLMPAVDGERGGGDVKVCRT